MGNTGKDRYWGDDDDDAVLDAIDREQGRDVEPDDDDE